MRTVATVVALLATPWLVNAAADEGGWTRFAVGAVIAFVGFVYLRHELRADQDRRIP